MTILPIEHKSIKAQTQKYSIKKEQNRTHEKTPKKTYITIQNTHGTCRHDMWPSLKSAPPATPVVGNLSSTFELRTVFCFRVNGGHGIHRQTDRQTLQT